MIFSNFSNFEKKCLSPKNIGKTFCSVWNNNYRLFFMVFSVALMLLGVYMWYQNIYRSEWSDEKKENYKNSQSRGVEFKEKEFKAIIEEIQRKSNNFGEMSKITKDIFQSYTPKKIDVNSQQVLKSSNSTVNTIIPQ
jgi:hypothetical protein